MGGKLVAVLSVAIGTILFLVMLSVVGFESVLEPFRNFSLLHLGMFLLSSALLYCVYVLRWASVLRHQGIKTNFLVLLRYKLISTAIGYLTPAARMGGEPVRAYLFKRHMRIKGRQSVSSIMLETTIGVSVDIVFISFMLLFVFLFLALPSEVASFALVFAIAALLVVAAYFSTLVSRHGPFSFFVALFYSLFRLEFLKQLIVKVRIVEGLMTEFLRAKKRGVLEAVLISTIAWPLTFLQYKFALLSIGFDASFTVILLSATTTALAAFFPIPAAFGVQEAGQFSLFSLIGAANVGIALSLLIRLKDLILTLLGLIMLSHEGLSVLEIFRHKNGKKK